MGSHGPIRRLGIVRGDGTEDELVLAQRPFRSPWPQHRLVLEAEALRLEGADHPARDRVAGGRPYELVEFRIELRIADRVPIPDALAHFDAHLAQLADVARGRLCRGLASQEPFERGPDFLYLQRLLVRNQADPGATVVLARHQPLLVEPHERCPHRGASGPSVFERLASTRRSLGWNRP